MSKSLSDILSEVPKVVGKPRVFVATPSCRDWKSEFGNSMMNLVLHLTSKFFRGEIEGIQFSNQPTSLLPLGREILLEQALASDSTHILWVDDDTAFKSAAVDLLISRNLDYVACNMVRKKFPITNTAYGKDGKQVSSVGKTGVEEVFHVGLGMTMIKLDVLRNIPAPRFEITWKPELGTYQGEDMYLCDKLRAAGVKLHIDHDASDLVGHIGDFIYTQEKVELKRDAA